MFLRMALIAAVLFLGPYLNPTYAEEKEISQKDTLTYRQRAQIMEVTRCFEDAGESYVMVYRLKRIDGEDDLYEYFLPEKMDTNMRLLNLISITAGKGIIAEGYFIQEIDSGMIFKKEFAEWETILRTYSYVMWSRWGKGTMAMDDDDKERIKNGQPPKFAVYCAIQYAAPLLRP